jgi:hypothetical protein
MTATGGTIGIGWNDWSRVERSEGTAERMTAVEGRWPPRVAVPER